VKFTAINIVSGRVHQYGVIEEGEDNKGPRPMAL